MEYKYYENVGTQVVIGQSCNIGNRKKYQAVSCVTGKFVNIWPEDVCIFFGHEGLREIALVGRLDEIARFAIGVLTPYMEN